MRQSHSQNRLPAAWLLMTLAVLTALSAPPAVGHSALLAALIFAGAAGYALGNNEFLRPARPQARPQLAGIASQTLAELTDVETVYRTFDHVVVTPTSGALARLRSPRPL